MAVDKNWEELKKAMQESGELRKRLSNSDDVGDRLYYQLCYAAPRDIEGWMELYGQVHEYLRGENPDEKKKCLMQYTEMLVMITSGYERIED